MSSICTRRFENLMPPLYCADFSNGCLQENAARFWKISTREFSLKAAVYCNYFVCTTQKMALWYRLSDFSNGHLQENASRHVFGKHPHVNLVIWKQVPLFVRWKQRKFSSTKIVFTENLGKKMWLKFICATPSKNGVDTYLIYMR